MIKLKLNYRTYKLPERFTIQQWKDIMKLDFEDFKSWPKIMGIALNKPYSQFMMVEDDSLILGVSLILNELGKRRATNLKDFNQLRLGEFIDLDIWVTMGAEKTLDEILSVAHDTELKYIDEALYVVDQFMNWRISTYRSYSALFGLNHKGEQVDVDEEDWDPQKIAKGWYKVLVDLADNDILKLDPITEQPLKKAFNFMALRKEQMEEEQLKQRQQRQQYDLQRRNK